MKTAFIITIAFLLCAFLCALLFLHHRERGRLDVLTNDYKNLKDASVKKDARLAGKDKELAERNAENRALREERDALRDKYESLTSRIATISREMPSGLAGSRKAERLSVSLHKYITETPEGVYLQIVVPDSVAAADEKKD